MKKIKKLKKTNSRRPFLPGVVGLCPMMTLTLSMCSCTLSNVGMSENSAVSGI